MEENRMVKRVSEECPGGRRKISRPKKQWLDDTEEYLRLMNVKRWRNKITEKDVWAKIIWEAKDLHVL
jgi:hypothetical protein